MSRINVLAVRLTSLTCTSGGNLPMAYLVTCSTLAQAGVLLLQVYKGGAVLLPKWLRPRRYPVVQCHTHSTAHPNIL
jgi:hypothetical protein